GKSFFPPGGRRIPRRGQALHQRLEGMCGTYLTPLRSKSSWPGESRQLQQRGAWPCWKRQHVSGQDFVAHRPLTLRSNESLLQALVAVAQVPGIEAEQMKDGGLQVSYGHLVGDDVVAELVGLAERNAALDAGAGEPDGEAVRVVVPAQELRAAPRLV